MKDGKFEKGEFSKIRGAYEEFAGDAIERRQFKKGLRHVVQRLVEKHPDAPLNEVYPYFLGLLRQKAGQIAGGIPELVRTNYGDAMIARVGAERLESFYRVALELSNTYRSSLLDQIQAIELSDNSIPEKENKTMQAVREMITLIKDRLKHDPTLLNRFRGKESLLDEVISDWALAQRDDAQKFIREKRVET